MDTGTLDDELLAGRYRVGGLLGRGGMANVYEGLDLRLQRPVAVKLLRPDMAAQPGVRRLFEEEARSAARLSHPNAVAVFDTGEDRGRPFMVMERLPGETLADRIRRGPADQTWLLGVAHDVLAALAAAHAAGLVHRDVKPGNILMGADGRAKVADFGIAKSLEAFAYGPADVTAANALVGTPAYLAPETLDGEPATPRSDIWALGAVLFECLAATKPFPGTTPAAVAAAIQGGVPLSLRHLRPDVSAGLCQAVERAVSRRPADRFPTAEAMARALGPRPEASATWRPPTEVGADATLVSTDRHDLLAGAGGVEGAGGATVHDRADTHIAPPGVVVAGAGGQRGGPRRRLWRVFAAALSAAVLVMAASLVLTAGRGRAGSGGRATPALSLELRNAASRVRAYGPGAGPQGPETARRLDEVAAAIEGGGGAVEAQALVADVESWQAGRELAAPAVGDAMRVLVQVPGVTLEPPAPPTTLSVGGNGRGKGHGKGNDSGSQGGGGD